MIQQPSTNVVDAMPMECIIRNSTYLNKLREVDLYVGSGW